MREVRWALLIRWVVAALLLGACTPSGSAPPTTTSCCSTSPSPECLPKDNPSNVGPPPGAPVVDVLAGSELSDVEPLLLPLEAALGIDLRFTKVGSLEGADMIRGGATFDLAWFSSAVYLERALDQPELTIRRRASIMSSPVILGVKQSVAADLEWRGPNISWSTLEQAAATGAFRFAMTDPATSNTGFSTLLASARALSAGRITSDALNVPALTRLFSGHTFNSRSSGLLRDAYLERQTELDGLFNYESVLLEMNKELRPDKRLQLLYPTEGVVVADYPLMLLNPSQEETFDRLVSLLKESSLQCRLALEASLRPILEVGHGMTAFEQRPIEIPPSVSRDDMNRLLATFLNLSRRPSTVVYVLDVSGSMKGARLEGLQDSLRRLTGLKPLDVPLDQFGSHRIQDS